VGQELGETRRGNTSAKRVPVMEQSREPQPTFKSTCRHLPRPKKKSSLAGENKRKKAHERIHPAKPNTELQKIKTAVISVSQVHWAAGKMRRPTHCRGKRDRTGTRTERLSNLNDRPRQEKEGNVKRFKESPRHREISASYVNLTHTKRYLNNTTQTNTHKHKPVTNAIRQPHYAGFGQSHPTNRMRK